MIKLFIPVLMALLISLSAASTNSTNTMTQNDSTAAAQNGDVKVLMHTSMGDITILLYGETPKHRDNFLKLAEEGFYNDLLFHRVIDGFMVQAGDPDSRGAAPEKMLGSGGPGYQIDAEIVYPRYFHKRGALAAARQADQVNPERKSSGSQFYIVTGKNYTPGQLDQMEKQMQMTAMKQIFDTLAAQHRDSIMTMRRNRDQAGLMALQEELAKKTEKIAAEKPFKFTEAQREAYSTMGGTPHLDGTYSVFGELVDGWPVVKKLQGVETNKADRPLTDVKILSIEILK